MNKDEIVQHMIKKVEEIEKKQMIAEATGQKTKGKAGAVADILKELKAVMANENQSTLQTE